VIIRQIQLHPFAGISERTVDFTCGLNVILGPNEAGKSSLIRAIRTVLLEPTDHRKSKWDNELSSFVPIGGGDTFRISLRFQSQGGEYLLRKQWGSQPLSELTLPGNQGVVNAPDTVQRQMDAILELKPGTWDHVLFAYQAQLPGTLKHLGGKNPVRTDLAQILRDTVFTTDGVSIEKLGGLLHERLENITYRWDEATGRPEKNRGIDNPWSLSGEKQISTLVGRWYQKEQLLAEIARVKAFEESLDRIATQIKALTGEHDELQDYVRLQEPVVVAIRGRSALDARVTLSQQQVGELKKVVSDWPTLIERQRALRAELELKEAEQAKLDEELEQALQYARQHDKRIHLRRVQSAIGDLQAAQESLSKLKIVPEAELKKLELCHRAAEMLKAGLSAGRLQVKVFARQAIDLAVQSDLADPDTLNIPAGSMKEIVAGGQVVMTHPDWRIEVRSGEIEFDELQQQYQKAAEEVRQITSQLDVEDLEDARLCNKVFDQARLCVANREEVLRKELNGESVESLTAALGIDLPVPSRDYESVLRARVDQKGKLDQDHKTLEANDSQLSEWTSRFGSSDGLLEELLVARASLKRLTDELDALPKLPDGIEDAEVLINEFQKKANRLRTIRETDLPNARLRKAQLGNEPELSMAEAEQQLRDAEAGLDHLNKQWHALKRIDQVFQALQSRLDAGTLDPWQNSLRSALAPITAGEYCDVNLDKTQARRGTDFELPNELLSMGTRSCLGLAIRISMAEHFLKGKDGFFVLDDPLVDMDSERQKQVAAIVQRFAEKHQVILVTCHPQHAELLGGHRISFDRTY